jgi:reactive intermediate/imine deaminase
MYREIISTADAPQAIGTYSQAVRTGNTVYLSGQIPLVPETMELVDGDMRTQIVRVFDNLSAVAKASGGSLADIAKLNIYLTNLSHFPLVNEIMADYFAEPFPARAAVGVNSLPKGAMVEMDAILVFPDQ